MKVVICASISSAGEVIKIKDILAKIGHEIVIPRGIEKYANGGLEMESPEESTENKIKGDLIRGYFDEIKNAEAVLVVNLEKKGIENYIGGNTFLEMGFAHVLDKKIYLLNPIPEMAYKDEILAMQPVILSGDLNLINK